MSNFGDRVPFNHAAAQSLVEELLSTASVLNRDIGDREAVSHRARQSWEGPYSQQFDGRVRVSLTDAGRFVAVLRAAANHLVQLANLAQQEQRRRELVKQWEAARAAYIAAGYPPPPMPNLPPIVPPPMPPFDCRPTPRGTATSAGGWMTGRSSADPDQLDRWVAESRAMDEFLIPRLASLESEHNAFRMTSPWGNFDAAPLIVSLRTYIRYNGVDGQWATTISKAFRDADSAGGADSSGSGVGLPNAAITSGLLKAGQPISSTGISVLEALPSSRVSRNAAGLIDRVDSQPVDQYLRDVGRRRAEQFTGTSSGVTAVAMNRRTGKVIEGGPLDVVKEAGDSGISRVAHKAGREPDVTTRLDAAQEQIEVAEWMRKSGDPAMVPALVRAARANIGDVSPRGRTDAGARSRLNDLDSRLGDLGIWMPRHRDQPLKLVPDLDPGTARNTRVPPESERVYVRDGRLVRADTDQPLEDPPRDFGYWSYVADEHGNLYIVNPMFGHRGVLGDKGRVSAAGMLGIVPGRPGFVSHMNTNSGGFSGSDLRQLQQLVEELGLDLRNVSESIGEGRNRGTFPDNSIRRPRQATQE